MLSYPNPVGKVPLEVYYRSLLQQVGKMSDPLRDHKETGSGPIIAPWRERNLPIVSITLFN